MSTEKTVFISYRRSTSTYQARAVYQSLAALGYDAFLDFEAIDSGAFDQVILNQIRARAHFVLILAPGAVDRCTNPNDWLRREVEAAMDHERNIVPLMFSGFSFSQNRDFLTGKLANLSRYNGVPIYAEYFDEAIERLHTRFLSKPLNTVLHPVPPQDAPIVEKHQQRVAAEPAVTESDLNAAYIANRAHLKAVKGEWKDAIADYTEAIRLNPDFADAYHNRSVLHTRLGDLKNALADADTALRLNDAIFEYHLQRGFILSMQGDLDDGIASYQAALKRNPNDMLSYNNIGWVYYLKEEYDLAVAYADKALRLEAEGERAALAFHTRGAAYLQKGDCDKAISDFEQAVQLDPADKRYRAELVQARQQCEASEADA